MNKIVIWGAGGFGREVQWLIERINIEEPIWDILGYLDDNIVPGTLINGLKVLGGEEKLKEYDDELAVVCAIGSAKTRKKVINRIKSLGHFYFPNLIDPSVQISQYVTMGEGNIICAGNILTVNILIEDFVILNLDCTVGHDAMLHSFSTIYPSVNISGGVRIGVCAEVGTGCQIIQGKDIGNNTIIGAGGVVVKDIPENCTAIGMPAKPVKFFTEE